MRKTTGAGEIAQCSKPLTVLPECPGSILCTPSHSPAFVILIPGVSMFSSGFCGHYPQVVYRRTWWQNNNTQQSNNDD